MGGVLTGKTIALAEGRQLEELAQMLEKEGASPLRCPMVSILDAPNETPVLNWLRDLIAGRFDLVVYFTGEGIRRLLSFAERAGIRSEVIEAMGKTPSLVRGPKPVKALKEVNLSPTTISSKPTTDGVITSLREITLQGKVIGVQMYSPVNPPLKQFLEESGAEMVDVLPYVYAPDSDGERVTDLIQRMTRGEINVLILTSSPQVDRLLEVAKKQNLEAELSEAWEATKIAAVGPVVADTLRQYGAPVDITPEQGFVMKNLVKQIINAFRDD